MTFYSKRFDLFARLLIALAIVAAVADELPAQSLASNLWPNGLRCEYLVNPQGIDSSPPRLEWVIESSSAERGRRQTAYQILVAASEAGLRAGRGDLWDSGRVYSNQTAQISYAGQPLQSG